MYVDEPPKDGNIPDFNISKIDICPFRAYQRSFRLFQSDFSKDIHQRSRLLCFTQNDHTGHAGFKICPFLKWAQLLTFVVCFSAPNYILIPKYTHLGEQIFCDNFFPYNTSMNAIGNTICRYKCRD